MNILIHYYKFGYYIGGAEVVDLKQYTEFLKQGHSFTILTADTSRYSKILKNTPDLELVELPLKPIKTAKQDQ